MKMFRSLFAAISCCVFSVLSLSIASASPEAVPSQSENVALERVGSYVFEQGAFPKVSIHYALPETYSPETPIVFVIPGARRNADDYRDAWLPYAREHGFAVMTLECNLTNCPTEYSYNAGGVTNSSGKLQPEDTWLFSVLDPAFEDFKLRTGLTAPTYALYGHSAGGSFVHMFRLFKPQAKVSHSVSANAAFFLMPTKAEKYPFGFKNIKIKNSDVKTWMAQDMAILLGDKDVGPRTKKLSNGPKGRAQGPSVFARGLLFFHNSLSVAAELDVDLKWQIEVAHGVGHSNTNMIPFALKYLGVEGKAEGEK